MTNLRKIKFLLPLLIMLSILFIAACSQHSVSEEGPKRKNFNIKSIGKSDIDTVLEIHVREMRQYLGDLMVKLYRRNPRELTKSEFPEIRENIDRVFNTVHNWQFQELDNKLGTDAINLTFDDSFEGDRVFSFTVGLASMVMASYGHRRQFYITDSVDPQKLYNSARNLEIAFWKLGNTLNTDNDPYLFSNSLPGETVNYSYERLYGKMIATQDNMAIVIADKTNRGIKKILQQMATAVFLPI